MNEPNGKRAGKAAMAGLAALAALLTVQMTERAAAADVPQPASPAMLTLDLRLDLGMAGAALRLRL